MPLTLLDIAKRNGMNPADVIFDPIGGEATETTWTCAARGGRYLAGEDLVAGQDRKSVV